MNGDHFLSSSPICKPLIFFCCFIVLPGMCPVWCIQLVLNRSGEREHPSLDLNGKAFSFLPLSMMFFLLFFLLPLWIMLIEFQISIPGINCRWLWGTILFIQCLIWFANIVLTILTDLSHRCPSRDIYPSKWMATSLLSL